MGSDRWEFYVWIARYYDPEDIIQMKEKKNGAIEVELGTSIWSQRGKETDWPRGGWPPRRIRIVAEEIDQPLEGWGPLC